jgi:hypothetical protein
LVILKFIETIYINLTSQGANGVFYGNASFIGRPPAIDLTINNTYGWHIYYSNDLAMRVGTENTVRCHVERLWRRYL